MDQYKDLPELDDRKRQAVVAWIHNRKTPA
jgi:hypothetical protein